MKIVQRIALGIALVAAAGVYSLAIIGWVS